MKLKGAAVEGKALATKSAISERSVGSARNADWKR